MNNFDSAHNRLFSQIVLVEQEEFHNQWRYKRYQDIGTVTTAESNFAFQGEKSAFISTSVIDVKLTRRPINHRELSFYIVFVLSLFFVVLLLLYLTSFILYIPILYGFPLFLLVVGLFGTIFPTINQHKRVKWLKIEYTDTSSNHGLVYVSPHRIWIHEHQEVIKRLEKAFCDLLPKE